MRYRHNDKSVYDNVINVVRSTGCVEPETEKRLETLRQIYGHTYEYERAINQINNYIMKKATL